jgi:hypothetical protein
MNEIGAAGNLSHELPQPEDAGGYAQGNQIQDAKGKSLFASDLNATVLKKQIATGDRGYAIDVLVNASCSMDAGTRRTAKELLDQVRKNPGTKDSKDDDKVREMIADSERVMTRLLLTDTGRYFGE